MRNIFVHAGLPRVSHAFVARSRCCCSFELHVAVACTHCATHIEQSLYSLCEMKLLMFCLASLALGVSSLHVQKQIATKVNPSFLGVCDEGESST